MEQQQEPSVAVEAKKKEQPTEGIDFGSINALANSDFKPEPWYKSFGYSILEKVLGVLLFVLGFVLDIFKALWTVVKGIFVGIYKLALAIYRFCRNIGRMCAESDKYVKMSTFCSGLGNIHGGQLGDGIVFLAVEIIFIIFMVVFGGQALYNFFAIGYEARGITIDDMDLNSSILYLVSGVLTFIAIGAYVFVWYSGLKSAYDNYVIRHNFRFLQARADQVAVLKNLQDYGEFYTVVDAKDKDGKPYKRMKFKRPGQIRHIARKVYGYSDLSARYISYIEFNHLEEKPLNILSRIGYAIEKPFYRCYDKIRNKIRVGKWSSVFAAFLEWKFEPLESRYGAEYVMGKAVGGFNKFRHTYDKYNDYLSYVRDTESLLKVLENGKLLEESIFQEDPVSKQNGLEPIPHGTQIKPKVAASRVVGVFECPYNDAVKACTYYFKALKEQPKTGVTPLEKIDSLGKALRGQLDEFIAKNRTRRLASIHKVEELYASYDELRDFYATGRSSFVDNLEKEYAVSRFDGRSILKDLDYCAKNFAGDEAKTREFMALRAERHKEIVERYETYPFHGQPIRFKKKMKQFTDERFAVTVMSLPVLGALITCIVPLLISILIAFTDYYGANFNHPNGAQGIFNWSFVGWQQMFSNTSATSTGNLGPTFTYILGWTLIWAIFATFSNYILGIVLALLINKKSIKFKKVFRTFFVVSIAIPQFVTLLAMSKILGVGGPIHTMAMKIDPNISANYWWLNDPANDGLSAKICLILVNCWVGIPYTMLSTSGILMNIPEDLYESARIDGASPWTQFWKITMPYILFVTGPSLLTSFIGNINNFNVIYFLTGGNPKPIQSGILNTNAGYTDLLITFLYKLTVNSPDKLYNIGSVIGILTFVICAFFSLIMYSRMGSTKNEEAFQ